MSRTAFLGLGLLAGLVLGFILGSVSRGDPVSEGDALALIPPRGGGGSGAARAGDDPTGAPIETGEFAASIEALADVALPAPSEPAEGGEITGTVTAADGRPVAGALIRATPHESDSEIEPEDAQSEASGDLRARIRRLAGREQRAHQRERRAVTDASGRYVLTGIAKGAYQIEGWARGFELDSEDSEIAWYAIAGRRVNFVASPVAEVAVEVLLPDGGSPSGAVVSVASGGSGFNPYDPDSCNWARPRPWTPERAQLRLSSGLYSLRATSGDEAYASKPVPVFIGPAGSHGGDPVVLRLEAQALIAGRVVLPEGVDGGLYSLQLQQPSEFDYPREVAGLEDGVFRYAGLDPGEYRLVVTLLGVGEVLSEKVTLRRGESVERVLRVTTPPDLSGIVVRVFGPEDRPLPGASVEVGTDRWLGHWGGDETAEYAVIPRPDASFVLRRLEPGDGRPPPQWIHVRTPTFGKRLVPFPGSGATEISVRMEMPGQLEVTLRGGDSTVLDGAVFLHTCPPAEDGSSLVARNDLEEGRTVIGPLQPGTYDLRLHGSGWGGALLVDQEGIRVVVAPGPNAVTLAAPAVHRLTIQQVGQCGAVLLERRVSGEWVVAGYYYPEDDGSVTYDGLAAGAYRACTSTDHNRVYMQITVPCGPVVFRPRIPKALRVALDPEGVLTASGLQVGDIVIGVSERPFAGDRSPWTMLEGYFTAQDRTTLSVRRGGRTLEIAVDAARVSELILGGGVLEPVFE